MESMPFYFSFGTTTFWLILFAALLMSEVAAAGTLVSIWFCGGALVAALLSYTGFGLRTQFIVFVISSAVMMLSLRPAAVKYFNKDFQPTKADGKIWTAININEDERLPAGTEVTIEEIKGIRVFVKKAGKDV